MKTLWLLPLRALALAAGAIVVSTFAEAANSSFLRPAVMWVEPTENAVDAEVGGLVQLGGSFDEGDLMLEAGRVSFSESGELLGYTGEANLRAMPILATARWRAKFDKAGRISGLLGGSFGVTEVRVSATGTNGLSTLSGSDSAWAWTYGADAALELRVAERFDLIAGYKYLVVSSPKLFDVNLGKLKANVFYAGAGFRF